jgi:hypothetical protein
VMAAIGIAYTLLIVFELWRGLGDQVWRWPIIVPLLAHAAAIPIHIPLAGTWTHPDPSDPSDLEEAKLKKYDQDNKKESPGSSKATSSITLQ